MPLAGEPELFITTISASGMQPAQERPRIDGDSLSFLERPRPKQELAAQTMQYRQEVPVAVAARPWHHGRSKAYWHFGTKRVDGCSLEHDSESNSRRARSLSGGPRCVQPKIIKRT